MVITKISDDKDYFKKKQVEKDAHRQKIIKEKLNCEFVRIADL